MATIYKATLVAEDGKKVSIEIEDPDSSGTTNVSAEADSSTGEGSFTFIDSSGKRLTITIAE